MNLMLRQTGSSASAQPQERRKRDREVVQKILAENEKFRTKSGFFQSTDEAGHRSESNGKQLKVYPDEIIFKDIKPGQTYEINVIVRNLTKVAKRIKVSQPTTSKFRCDYDMAGTLAPGLPIELVVSFSTTKEGEFHDRIVITSDGDYKFEIPLHAYSPIANIVFEPFINMGFIPVGQEKRYKAKFKNEGTVDGQVELRTVDLPDFKIEPQPNFKVKVGKTTEVDFVYTPREAGIFRGIVEVFQEGQAFMNHIDVNATSVEFLKFIVDTDGNEMGKVDFGDVFFGQKKEIKGFLVNNSPKPFKFHVNFIHGLHNNYDERNNLKTPVQEGLQQTQRVMSVTPSEGVIDTYSQIPITFYCHSKVQEDHVIWVRNNSFKKSRPEQPKRLKQPARGSKQIQQSEDSVDLDEKARKNHEYTALFNFENGPQDSKLLMMTATCVCPHVSFGEESNFDFGTIKVNEIRSRRLEVANMHSNLEVDISFPNVSVFYVVPTHLHLKAGEKKSIEMFFHPRSLGKFARKVEFLVNQKFPVAITFTGKASDIAEKNKFATGPLPIDFDTYDEKKYFQDGVLNEDSVHQGSPDTKAKTTTSGFQREKSKGKTSYPFKGNPKLARVVETTEETQIPYVEGGTPMEAQNMNEYQIAKYNSHKANDYLTAMRLERDAMKKRGFIVGQNKTRAERIKSYSSHKNNQPAGEAVGSTVERQDRLDSPRMGIPAVADTLFVVKPIANYEPYPMYDFSAHFSPDQVNPHPFTEKPDTHAEIRDVTAELSGEELQKIHVGPTEINFGRIFVKSNDFRYFQIKNDLRKPISAKLSVDGIKELEDSYQRAQIIPSNKTASFKISFSSYGEQMFERYITYTINDKHIFKIRVVAQVTQVILTLKKTEEEFIFDDDKFDMKITKDVVIQNNGNATAHFDWNESVTKCYSIQPMSGSVYAQGEFTCKVTYTPSGNKLVEEEELLMRVVDGPNRTLLCKAILNDVKCEWVNPYVDFGIMSVSEKKTVFATLVNKLSKTSAVFAVDLASLPQGLEISPLKERIPGDESCKFELTFCNPRPVKYENREIRIDLREVPPAILFISAQTIIPEVRIKEEEFHFGEVTLGNTEGLTMTLINDSQIDVLLTLDLRENEADPESEAYSKMDIKYLGDNEGDEDQVLEEKDLEDIAKPEFKQMKELRTQDFIDESNEEDETLNDKDHSPQERSRFYTIKLKKKKQYEFELRFSPQLQKAYKFTLPICLAGFERIESINRKVYCQGIMPKLVMEPINGEVVFEKKIITSMDAVIPQHASITFSNSQDSRPLSFRIDTSNIERKDIFTVIPTQGTIDPQVPVTIKVSFKPMGNEKYEEELPLYLEGDHKPYTTIRLKGEGAYPKLLFDRREVILPIVPLGIESKCTFKIENEGYQNLILKYYQAQDFGAFKLKVDLPDGKTLGTTTNTLRVDVSFSDTKPISFTTKLVFEDEAKHIYPIFVSATTDNCLLTNYPFFQVHDNEYRLYADTNKPIKIDGSDHDDLDSHEDSPEPRQSKSVASKSARSFVGFNPIPMGQLERSCKFCMQWLNNYVLNVEIENFPQDIISANGQQIYELIGFLTKRSPPQMSKIDPTSKKLAKIEVLYKQYETLITFLKENGAMLNTIRPEYLLSHQDMLTYYKRNYNQYASSSANKVSEKHFRYVSMDAWTILFFQILKIYYLCRVTLKTFKNMKELPADRPLLPEGYTEVSPVYSQQEIILLRWLELALDKIFPGIAKGRLVNFDVDIKNGLALGALLQMYIGNTWKKLYAHNLKTSINSEEEMKNNFEKVKSVLREYGITPMPDMFETAKPNAREVVVYLIHLFQLLPNFLPKPPLDFQVMLRGTCIRTVQLTNPSSKKITYGVKLECPTPDFTIDRDSIDIDPKGQGVVNIKYTARISKQTKARVTFKNKKETGAQAIPIVFDLVSDVQGRYNEEIIKVENEVMLYESGTFEIPVHNPYNQSVTFTIRIENIPMPVEEKDKKRKPATKKPDDRVFLPAFFCKAETISISKNGTAKLPIYYLPITLEDHRCHLVFTDERVGEMQYEIQGKPIPPSPAEQKPIKFVCQLDNLDTQYLDVPRRNHRMEAALARLKDRIKDSKIMTNKTELLKKVDSVKENLTFYVECNQPFLQVPPVFALQPGKKATDEPSRQERTETHLSNSSELANKLPINLLYKYPVQNQQSTIMMFNGSRTDVRMYNIEVTVMPKKVKAQLEMKTPARIPLTQNIPVINTLDTEVSVKMQMDRIKNGDAFKLPFPTDQHVFKVGKEPFQFKLTFEPDWMVESIAKLTLFNRDTNEHFEYELRGVGEEPLAEKEYIVECKLKEDKVLNIDLEFTRKLPTVYQVEVDLPYATGAKVLEVPAGKTGRYVLKISPLLGGEFTGSVTFKTDQGQYYWYMVTLKVESSKFERHLEMMTHCRKAIQQEIELENPINETITFKVAIENEALTGSSVLVVPARSRSKYLLTFLPLSEFKEKTTVTFLNQKIGDVIYDILLVSDAPPAMKVGPIRCEIGNTERLKLKLENPHKEQARVTARAIDNPNFQLVTDQYVIPPNGIIEAEIIYTPSDLDKQDTAVVVFESKEIGSWTYRVVGMGVPPTRFKETVISGSLGKQTTNSIAFKNPFRETISINILLETENPAHRDVFSLVMKKTKVQIAPQQSIDITYNFFPKEITDYKTELILQMNDKISWRYPILALTESYNKENNIKFLAKCHQKVEEKYSFALPGVTNIIPDEQFGIQVVLDNQEFNQILSRWLVIEPEIASINRPEDQLKFNFKFHPHRPFESKGEIIIVKPSGGRWR